MEIVKDKIKLIIIIILILNLFEPKNSEITGSRALNASNAGAEIYPYYFLSFIFGGLLIFLTLIFESV